MHPQRGPHHLVALSIAPEGRADLLLPSLASPSGNGGRKPWKGAVGSLHTLHPVALVKVFFWVKEQTLISREKEAPDHKDGAGWGGTGAISGCI